MRKKSPAMNFAVLGSPSAIPQLTGWYIRRLQKLSDP